MCEVDFYEETVFLHKIYCKEKLYIYWEVRKWLYRNTDIPIPERGKDAPMMR
jgi:hypothetical protein